MPLIKKYAGTLACLLAISVLFLACGPATALAEPGDHDYDSASGSGKINVYYDADYATASEGYTVESDLFTEDKVYLGDSDTKTETNVTSSEFIYLASVIGDSHTANAVTQHVLNDRFGGEYEYRSIDGLTRVNYHDWSGRRTDFIADQVVGRRSYGSYEGADFVIIMAGTNNIDYDRYLDLDTQVNDMVSDIQRIIDWVIGSNTDPTVRPSIIVSGIPPFLDPNLTARAAYYNDALRTQLDKYDVFTDANWWDLVDSTATYANPDLMKDNKHPTDDGAYMMAENWFEAVDALFDYSRITDNPYIYKGPWYYYLGSGTIDTSDSTTTTDTSTEDVDETETETEEEVEHVRYVPEPRNDDGR